MRRSFWSLAFLALFAGAALTVHTTFAEDGGVEVEAVEVESPEVDVDVEVPEIVIPSPEEAEEEEPPAPKVHEAREGAEKFTFQAEVNRLMDIIIHSLYSNKDIFLRELISNASDALDKVRFLALSDAAVMGEGEVAKTEIKLSIDKDEGVISIRDRGIGMTRDDLIRNLGTIAKSGTSSFLEKMQQGGDINLIGQFGVGFYSVYLVADYVEVVTKNNDDKQYIWESNADGDFAISEDTEGEPLGRGTQINIYLKDECQEYLQEDKLRELVKTYSEFINFPIYMLTEKTIDVPVEEDEESVDDDDEEYDDDDDEEYDEDDDEDDEDEDDEEEDEPKTRQETVLEWDLLNDSTAIWLRPTQDVTEEEYQKFYKAIDRGATSDALTYTHFKAEGDVEFRSVLYIPSKAAFDFYDTYYSRPANLKLYVRRVFISDEFEDLLPKYLGFLKGLVDSDTLPLNVSREMLQAHSSLKTIKKKLVRKALDMIKKMAEAGKADEDEEEEEEDAEAEAAVVKAKEDYKTFWNSFGKAMKLGVVEDASNRNRLAKLLRFTTTKSSGELTSLDEYLDRMPETQDQIYYLCGESMDELTNSPFLERLLAKDLEVILFTDPVDEYMMQNLLDYEGKKFSNASKEDLKFGKDDKEKKRAKEIRAEFKDLTKWWKTQLGEGEVESVKVSNRLATTPCVVVTSKYGWSANMQRIMQAQALGDQSRHSHMKAQRTLEINPRHPLIKEMKAKVEADAESEEAAVSANLLYQTALLESGFILEDPKDFAKRIHSLIKDSIGMEADLDDIEEEAEEDDEEEDEEADEPETPDANEINMADIDLDALEELANLEAEMGKQPDIQVLDEHDEL